MAKVEDYPIMVVDDDEPIVKNLRRLLKRQGFNKITTALTGEQGLKLLEREEIPGRDIVLLLNDDTEFEPDFLEKAETFLSILREKAFIR